MDTTNLILFVLAALIFCLAAVVRTLISKVDKLEDDINSLSGDLTTHVSHTQSALKGMYTEHKDLENDFKNHCHAYEVNDDVLYIKEPIINENIEETDD